MKFRKMISILLFIVLAIACILNILCIFGILQESFSTVIFCVFILGTGIMNFNSITSSKKKENGSQTSKDFYGWHHVLFTWFFAITEAIEFFTK